jgi:hypothetical protein
MPGGPLRLYDLVLADPPYSTSDAERYGVPMVNRNKVMRELGMRTSHPARSSSGSIRSIRCMTASSRGPWP